MMWKYVIDYKCIANLILRTCQFMDFFFSYQLFSLASQSQKAVLFAYPI